LKECEYIKKGFVCIKWSDTTKNGTKATYAKVSDGEIEKRRGI
jgi:hypothetical protein